MPQKYRLKITYPSGRVYYMTHNGRDQWSRSQAYVHLRDWVHLHGFKVRMELSPNK